MLGSERVSGIADRFVATCALSWSMDFLLKFGLYHPSVQQSPRMALEMSTSFLSVRRTMM